MTNNNKVEWILYGEIYAACESCKFPRHDGPCASAPSLLKQDQIVTLNIGCEYCREDFRRNYRLLRVSFPIKLTYEERKPVSVRIQIHPDDFKGLSDVESRIKSLPNIPEVSSPVSSDKFEEQLKDSIYNLSSSGQHLWKTVFGNEEKNIPFLVNLRIVFPHLFCHQMAYFLSAIDIEDKDSFLGRGEMHWIRQGLSVEDMYMLIPIVGLDRIKARIENSIDETETRALELAFLYYVVKNQREVEQAGELDKDRVGEIACKYGVPYVHVSSHPSMFSLDGFCPLEIMEISTLNSSSRFRAINSSSRFKLRPQNVRASAQLVFKIDVHSQNIEVSINISNVRCRILSDKSSDQEKYFPSRIQIRVTPSKDCEMRTQSFRVRKSGNDPPRTLSREEQWEAGIELPKGPVNLKVGGKFGISSSHTNWRFEMNDCSRNSSAGYFQWTLFDNANGLEVWSADSRNYKQLMDRGSSLRNRGSHLSSPFTSDGGCVFSEDLFGQPLIWSLDKRVEGTTSSWRIEMDVWLTYCYNVSRNDCLQTASWTFTESLEMKL